MSIGAPIINLTIHCTPRLTLKVPLVYPNGTTVQLGGILGGCQTYQGVIYNFKFSCPIIGTYVRATIYLLGITSFPEQTAIANTTYQIGNCSTQQYTSTQTFIVQDAFQVSAENVSSSDGGGCFGPGCNDNGTLTTTTVRFDHEPTGTVSSSSSKQFVLLGAVVEPRMMLLVVAMLSMLVSC